MRRWPVLAALAFAFAAAPPGAPVGSAEKIPRIGILGTFVEGGASFRHALSELGYVEGRNIVIERPAGKGSEDLPRIAGELMRLKVDVVVALATQPTHVARQAITGIPVVFVTFADPVGAGLVSSLARPDRNMTGVTLIGGELAGKRLELLQQAFPGIRRVAVLWNPSNRDVTEQMEQTKVAARSLGLELQPQPASASRDLEGVFAAIGRLHADALFVLPDSMFFAERQRLVRLVEKSRLPAIYHWRVYADAGGLMSYGPNLTEAHRQAAIYVDISKHVGRVNRESMVIDEMAA
jgi:putative tryptophan/tyrosine transport system substrate-binding protein